MVYNKVTVLSQSSSVGQRSCSSACLLVLFIHPSSHLSLSLFCEMPVIHCCDSGWAIGLSCSGAPAEAQFAVVLWCIDPLRPPSRMYSMAARSAQTSLCRGSPCGARSHTAATNRTSAKTILYPRCDDLVSSSKPELSNVKAFKLNETRQQKHFG